MDLRHFSLHEFESPDAPGSGKEMDEDFLRKLDEIRHVYGNPLIVTSGYRTNQRNEKVGGVEDSAHTKGLAADLQVKNSRQRYELVKLALCFGISRIGIGEDFVHLDVSDEKAQNVIWNYN